MIFKDWLIKNDLSVDCVTCFEEAFIHRSFKYEHPNLNLNDNQRLEFMGDAVLQLWTAQYLYRLFPQMEEGPMTKLRASMVCEASLAHISHDLGLSQFLKLGKGEIADRGDSKPSTLADLFEAFIGALYLNGDFKKVDQFLSRIYLDVSKFEGIESNQDFKTQLQEYVQAEDRRSIEYILMSSTGPANQREFEMAVMIDSIIYGKGKGSSKKRAEQKAAQEALLKMAK